jgi:bifunctional DNA-binding transcriptional regulator/antitoxin component of YhaV-PrlF toxin-antitoxin module
MLVRVHEDGTVIFPDDFLDSVGLDVGDELEIRLEGDRVVLSPVGKQLGSLSE